MSVEEMLIMTAWRIEGRDLANCNCGYGCPCQFGELPTYGNCDESFGLEIDIGHHGDTKLDGLRAAGLFKFPGAIHDGNGEGQLIIDERADANQRAALEAILCGEDTDEMATLWCVYAAMAPNRHETLFKPISLKIDVDERRGHVSVPGVFEMHAEPIRDPESDAPHRAYIGRPTGLKFDIAEIGSGSTVTSGVIDLPSNRDTYAQFARLNISNTGVIRD